MPGAERHALPVTALTAIAPPLALFAVAICARLLAAGAVDFPPTEPSAYYVDVARNMVQGQGLVANAVWSFAVPPHVAPKPAFDLWLPMGSLVAVPAMYALGPTLGSAQVAHALLGALLAPLAWWIAGDAVRRNRLQGQRGSWVALTAGLLVAVLGPLLVAAAAPDSTTPFAVFATAAVVAAPRALGSADRPPSPWHAVAVGVLLGLAYLSRQEAIYVAAVYLAAVVGHAGRQRRTSPRRYAALALIPVVAAGALTVLPWLARNGATFGPGLATQVLENAFLTRNDEVFAWLDRPDAASFLGQGAVTIGGNVATALLHNLVTVLLVPTAAVGLIGLVAAFALRRSPALDPEAPLGLLAIVALITFLATSLAFPVATLAGTYLHGAGPAYVALAVLAALATDRALSRISHARRWSRANLWLGPVALGALAVPFSVVQLSLLAAQTAAAGERVQSAASATAAAPSTSGPVISDRPIWLASVTGAPVIALPDEAPANVWNLANVFGARLVVIVERRGRYPDAMSGTRCFESVDGTAGAPGTYRVSPTCDEQVEESDP